MGKVLSYISALWAKHQIIVFFCLRDCLYLLSLFPDNQDIVNCSHIVDMCDC